MERLVRLEEGRPVARLRRRGASSLGGKDFRLAAQRQTLGRELRAYLFQFAHGFEHLRQLFDSVFGHENAATALGCKDVLRGQPRERLPYRCPGGAEFGCQSMLVQPCAGGDQACRDIVDERPGNPFRAVLGFLRLVHMTSLQWFADGDPK